MDRELAAAPTRADADASLAIHDSGRVRDIQVAQRQTVSSEYFRSPWRGSSVGLLMSTPATVGSICLNDGKRLVGIRSGSYPALTRLASSCSEPKKCLSCARMSPTSPLPKGAAMV